MNKKECLKKKNEAIEKIGENTKIYIENAKEHKGKLMENIASAEKYQRYLEYTFEMINDSIEKADTMPDSLFHNVNLAADTVMTSGATFSTIAQESKDILANSIQHDSTINATATYVSSAASAINHVSKVNPDYFPNASTIEKKYEPENILDANIEYIKTQLPTIVPDISNDFNIFINKFRADSPDENKYTDLIGFRTTIFYKWIFKYARSIAGNMLTRKQAIEFFVTNGNALDSSDRPTIENLFNLWRELSNQDDFTPNSVKLGEVTKEYNEQLFVRLIAGIAAILKLRQKYH